MKFLAPKWHVLACNTLCRGLWKRSLIKHNVKCVSRILKGRGLIICRWRTKQNDLVILQSFGNKSLKFLQENKWTFLERVTWKQTKIILQRISVKLRDAIKYLYLVKFSGDGASAKGVELNLYYVKRLLHYHFMLWIGGVVPSCFRPARL